MTKRKICIVTGSRAEYGLLYWLIKEVNILNNQSLLTPREISETYLSMVDGLWQRILFDPKMYSHVFCKDLIKKYFRNIYADEKRFV